MKSHTNTYIHTECFSYLATKLSLRSVGVSQLQSGDKLKGKPKYSKWIDDTDEPQH